MRTEEQDMHQQRLTGREYLELFGDNRETLDWIRAASEPELASYAEFLVEELPTREGITITDGATGLYRALAAMRPE